MFHLLSLLLPGLIPSWKFFKSVEPSPRVQWRVFAETDRNPKEWQEFRPRPESVSISANVQRLFWNPHWNESLFMVSLAERLTSRPTQHSLEEVFGRLRIEIGGMENTNPQQNLMQFRLVFVRRQGDTLVQDVTYVSEIRPVSEVAS